MSSYQAGHCNIGTRQRKRRFVFAAAAFLVAAILVALRIVGVVPSALLVAVFVPLAVGFELFVEGYSAFCVWLALLGRYDFRGEGGEAGEVTDREHRQSDQAQALKVAALSIALAAVTTALVVLLV